MGQIYTNKLKKMAKEKEMIVGAWEQIGNPVVAELLATCGFDTIVVDMEHGPIDIQQLPSLVQGIQVGGAVPFARAPWNDIVAIKKMLDCGIQGILIPYVSTAEEAKRAVSYCKYPPSGMRGFAKCTKAAGFGADFGDYTHRINDELMILVAIETPEGVKNVEEIAQVEGIDGIFIGPADLSTSMGYQDDPDNVAVLSAIDRIVCAARANGKMIGTIPFGARTPKYLKENHWDMVIGFSDVNHFAAAARNTAKLFKE